MGRILAVDYGGKRCGLAVTDALRLSINPLTVRKPDELLAAVGEYVDEGDLDTLVLTRSEHSDGTPNTIQVAIDAFAARVAEKYPDLEIAYQDEAGSSREASLYLRSTGVKKKKRSQKGALDSVSAAIILERYLRASSIW